MLHDDTCEYLVTGDATVSDDVESNVRYVRELNDREPETPKRSANEEKYDFIKTRVGKALVGWLGKRIIRTISSAIVSSVFRSQKSGPASPPPSRTLMHGPPKRCFAEPIRISKPNKASRKVCVAIREVSYGPSGPPASTFTRYSRSVRTNEPSGEKP